MASRIRVSPAQISVIVLRTVRSWMSTAPLHAPLAEVQDERLEFATRGGEKIFRPPLFQLLFPDDQTGPAFTENIYPIGDGTELPYRVFIDRVFCAMNAKAMLLLNKS